MVPPPKTSWGTAIAVQQVRAKAILLMARACIGTGGEERKGPDLRGLVDSGKHYRTPDIRTEAPSALWPFGMRASYTKRHA
jgi:hypothetical protein